MTFRMGSKKQLEDTWLSYMRRAEEADLKFKKAEAQWKRFKRQLSLVHWEHDFTRSQLEILSTTPKTLVMRPRRLFHQKQFFMMKADYYALLRDGPSNGKCFSIVFLEATHLFLGESIAEYDLKTRAKKGEIRDYFNKYRDEMGFGQEK